MALTGTELVRIAKGAFNDLAAVSDIYTYNKTQFDVRYAGTPAARARPPDQSDDTTRGYAAGSQWTNTSSAIVYECVQAATNAATWVPLLSDDTLPVDAVGSAAAAYGIRLLRRDYTGYCLQVRRASDSTTKNIGFVNGTLDLATLDAFLIGTTGSVATWYDQSGNGLDATQATSGSQPVIGSQQVGGLRMLSFTGQLGTQLSLTLPSGLSLSKTNSSVVGVASFRLSTYPSSVFEVGTPTAGYTYQARETSGNNAAISAYTGITSASAGTLATSASTIRPLYDPQVIGVHAASGSITVTHGNDSVTGSALAAGTVTGGLIGQSLYTTTQRAFEGDLGALIFFSTVLTATQQKNVRASLSRIFAATPQASDDLLVVDGDSIPTGYQTALGYPNQIAAYVHRPRKLYNMSVSGLTTTDYKGWVNTKLPQLPGSNYTNKIVLLNSGSNDLVANFPAADIYADMTTYTQRAQARGYKVILCTVLPRSDLTSGQQTVRGTLNALIVANGAGADAVADFGNDPTMGPQAAASSTTLYVDGIHPTVYGHSILTSIAVAAINNLSDAPVINWRQDAMSLPNIASNTTASLKTIQKFTSGTSATYTKPAGVRFIKLRENGGGGSGGAVAGAASSAAAAGGGGAGSYLEKWIDVTNASTGTYTVGSGGAAPTAGNNAGNAGGDTTFTIGGVTYTAKGGAGGAAGGTAASTVLIVAGGAGGTVATNGDVNEVGTAGDPGIRLSASVLSSGKGGASVFGGGGAGLVAAGAGNAATSNGAGGGGAAVTTNANQAGGAGAAGIVIVEEYY